MIDEIVTNIKDEKEKPKPVVARTIRDLQRLKVDKLMKNVVGFCLTPFLSFLK